MPSKVYFAPLKDKEPLESIAAIAARLFDKAGFSSLISPSSMGLASRVGKISQHSSVLPRVREADCVACKSCEEWCPAEAITVEKFAVIDRSALAAENA